MISLLRKSLTVDGAAEAIFLLMRKDFSKEWMSRLSAVSGLDLRRAETELVFLDFFAVFFSVKFTRSSGWRDKRMLVLEKLVSLFADWWGDAWKAANAGTREDAFKVLDERLKAYGEAVEDPSSADPEGMLRLIGLTYAMFAFAHDNIGNPGSRERAAQYQEFLAKTLLDYKNVVATVGGQVFNHRVRSLYGIFDSYKLR